MLGDKKKRSLPSYMNDDHESDFKNKAKTFDPFKKAEPKNLLESSRLVNPKDEKKSDSFLLSESQRAVLLAIMRRKSVFFTGSAGKKINHSISYPS